MNDPRKFKDFVANKFRNPNSQFRKNSLCYSLKLKTCRKQNVEMVLEGE